MDADELHALLTSEFDLVTDGRYGGARTYFLKTVDWHPASTTRIVQVSHDGQGRVAWVKKLHSSDNNHSVFMPTPLTADLVRAQIAEEIRLFMRRAA